MENTPVLHQPKDPGANRLRSFMLIKICFSDNFSGNLNLFWSIEPDFHSRISLVAGEIFAHEKCSNLLFCSSEPSI